MSLWSCLWADVDSFLRFHIKLILCQRCHLGSFNESIVPGIISNHNVLKGESYVSILRELDRNNITVVFSVLKFGILLRTKLGLTGNKLGYLRPRTHVVLVDHSSFHPLIPLWDFDFRGFLMDDVVLGDSPNGNVSWWRR